MDAKTLADAVKKGIADAEAQKKTGLTEAEAAEQELLKSLDGMDPKNWEKQAEFAEYQRQATLPKLIP